MTPTLLLQATISRVVLMSAALWLKLVRAPTARRAAGLVRVVAQGRQ